MQERMPACFYRYGYLIWNIEYPELPATGTERAEREKTFTGPVFKEITAGHISLSVTGNGKEHQCSVLF
ncbi:hypothetical protein [Niabella drilacis]|uniref:hypothetical protein n=1 Tax=Niabella drilacis (strain DSM 25811 / CCM 8410 / CCUG 62505 / LMG 26954 / E90) TaxID=1285928 RepID=UPI00115FB18D|nr:hypothetical protein [Niabella drilacis]